jgi:hypothetical protein
VHDNCNISLWHRIADDRTAEEAVKGLGTCIVELPRRGTAVSYGGVGGLSGSGSLAQEKKDRETIRPAWLTGLPRGEAFVRMRGEVWKVRMPLLAPVREEELAELGMTALWQQIGATPHLLPAS